MRAKFEHPDLFYLALVDSLNPIMEGHSFLCSRTHARQTLIVAYPMLKLNKTGLHNASRNAVKPDA